MESTDTIGDGRDIEEQSSIVRLLAIIGASVALLLLALVAVFLGFKNLDGGLFLLDIIEIVLGAAAGYAAIRLGTSILIALGISLVALLFNVVQWIVRVVALPFTLLEFVFILIVTGLIILDVFYVVFLWRLYRADLNNNNPDIPEADRREAVLNQEGNRIRMTGIFGLIGVAIMFVSVALLLGFDDTAEQLCFFSIGHLPVAIVAIFAATSFSGFVMIGIMIAGLVLLILDLLELIFRVTAISLALLETLSVLSIESIVLILINTALLLVDVMYIVTAFAYLYELSFGPDGERADGTPIEPDKADLEIASSQAPINALRRRGKKVHHPE